MSRYLVYEYWGIGDKKKRVGGGDELEIKRGLATVSIKDSDLPKNDRADELGGSILGWKCGSKFELKLKLRYKFCRGRKLFLEFNPKSKWVETDLKRNLDLASLN